MFKFFIVIGIILGIAILIWLYVNKNIIKKVIKYTWADLCIRYGKIKEDEIDYDDLIVKKEIEEKIEEDSKYDFPIKKSQAKAIAKKNNTLKTDFCRNSNRNGISFLSFNTYTTDLIEIESKKYWQFQVQSGDISWIIQKKHGTTYNDGYLSSNDLKFLRCLIDTESGDYIYYPNVQNYKERIVKYEDAIKGIVKINEQPPEWLSRLEKDEL